MSYSPIRRQDFAPSCPSGGTWWACGYGTYFVGCCARDPCEVTCAQGNLYPGAFDPSRYGTFEDATCGTGSKFYTCTAGQTFWGCCKTNACSQGGCPDGDLEPAILNREDLRSAYHATGGTTMTSATKTTTTSPTATTSPTTTDTLMPTQTPHPKQKTNIAAIAGGAAGGGFGLAVIIALLIYYICHAKKSRKDHTDSVVRRLSDLPAMLAEKDKGAPQGSDAPPGYSSPNPNLYSQGQQFSAYAHIPHQSYYPEPQEMSIEPLSPIPYIPRPNAGHNRGFSELSGDTAILSELGTRLPSPNKEEGFLHQTPRSSETQYMQPRPASMQTHFTQIQSPQEQMPPGPQTSYAQYSPRSAQSHETVENWIAYQNLHAQGER